VDATTVCAVCGVTAAFGTGAAAAQLFGGPRRSAGASSLARSLRRGVPVFLPLARRIVARPACGKLADEAVAELAERGYATTAAAAASVFFAASLAIAAVGAVVTGSAAAAVAALICIFAIAAVVLGHRADVRREAVHDAVPAVLSSMSSCFDAGLTLMQTFLQVADDAPEPLAGTFAKAAHLLQTGGSTRDALALIKREAGAAELSFVAAALDVQHQTGGAMGKVVDSAAEAAKDEIDIKRTLRVQTAQAKLSARVVTVVPFVMLAVFTLVSPGFLDPFLSGPAGFALLVCAVAMQAGGIVLVHRALAVEGAS
jgi:tight adherence protein B